MLTAHLKPSSFFKHKQHPHVLVGVANYFAGVAVGVAAGAAPAGGVFVAGARVAVGVTIDLNLFRLLS